MNIIYNLALSLLLLFPFASNEIKIDSGAVNIVFKSTDGGETWQDISEGLPEKLQEDAIMRDGLFATDSGLYLRVGDGLYYSKTNSTAPFWQKEVFPDEQGSIAAGNAKIFAYNYFNTRFLQKLNVTNTWSAVYTNFSVRDIRTIFETAAGTVFIGTDNGLFKSTDNGITWKQVTKRGWVMKIVETNGVLMTTSQYGILKSTDDGETWVNVLNEGGVGIAIEPIKGGVAVINFNTESNTRRVRVSYDGGETWQPIDGGLPADMKIASIIEVGEYFYCGHPAGVFRSSDKGKSWKLLLPSIDQKVFNLFVSGDVIYAIPRPGGC